MRRIFWRTSMVLVALGLAIVGYMYWGAVADPLVRRDTLKVAQWPERQPPTRILLVSDLHVAGPDMPPARVARLVEQMNALKPDLILFAGDFVSDKKMATRWYAGGEALAPLKQLRARYGVIAVLGNHDFWRDPAEISAALQVSGITLLRNEAMAAGPFAVGGVDDDFTGHAPVAQTVERMAALKGMPIIISHSPDIMPEVPDTVPLIVAGHTHCGQINVPGVDTLGVVTRYGKRYACGKIVEGGKTLYVSAGLGTSVIPLRFRAAPDMWLVTVEPR